MRISENKNNTVRFGSLKIGIAFRIEKGINIKTDANPAYNSVDLETGQTFTTGENQPVTMLPDAVVLEEPLP